MTALKKPVRRVSAAVAASYGPDRGKRLVVTIVPGPGGADMLELRPERTRRTETVLLADVYQWAIRSRVNATKMARLREKKAKKAVAREKRRWNRELRRDIAREDSSQ